MTDDAGGLASVGYALKQAQAALNAAMDAVLRPLGLTVAQYACLELLAHRPGLSAAELARGAFVSRQSMTLVLRGLIERGLLVRAGDVPAGRPRPTHLAPAGHELLHTARTAVVEVERRMLTPLTPAQRHRLGDDLRTCTAALGRDRVR